MYKKHSIDQLGRVSQLPNLLLRDSVGLDRKSVYVYV